MMHIDRRRFLAGATFAGAVAVSNPVAAATLANWRAYDGRLRARLDDAGGGAFDGDFARALLRLNNNFRQAEHVPTLRWDEGLAAAARAHAADMAHRNFFAHEAPEGFRAFDRASLLARDICGPVSENLAVRTDGRAASEPRQFQDMWETSPGHRQNLLRRESTHAGFGVVRTGATFHAAAVYAAVDVRLAQPLPLRVSDPGQLTAALATARPQVQGFTVTRPDEDPSHLVGKPVSIRPGVWQLRPYQPAGGQMLSVLSGPIFFA